jgi:hypothetical protein
MRLDDPSSSNPAINPTLPDESWRYRRFEGRLWYWTPQNFWLWLRADGHWVKFDPNQGPAVIVPGPLAHNTYYPPAAYWTGRYPGVGVGVRPYGNVNVGVGRRIGVDVWGPYGSVRVGRIFIGW